MSAEIDERPCFGLNPNIQKLGQGRQHILAHEIGNGARCRNDATCKCDGLELHFWRKICKVCGCRMDEHDVRLPDEYDHAQIVIGRLFGAREHFESVLSKNRPSLISVAGNYHNDNGRHSLGNVHLQAGNYAGAGQYQRSASSCSNSSTSSEKEREREKKAMRAMADPVYNFKAKVPNSQKVIEYAWAPINDELVIDKYMRALPEDLRPIVGTVGEENRRSRLQYQLPLYDCNVENSRFTDENDKKALGKFVENVRKNVIGMGKLIEVDEKLEIAEEESGGDDLADSLRKALGPVAVKCRECRMEIAEGEIGIKTDHGPREDIWHPACFKCASCNQLLVDIIYFYHNGKYYCGRHFADQHYPRCSGCDELIFAREYTFAEEKSWHFDHFACFKCDLKLGGHRYMTKDEQPHCIDCYMKYYAKTCEACKQKIGPDEKRLNYEDNHWHAKEECFRCYQCHDNLIGKKFMLKNHQIFCSSKCKHDFFDKK